MSAKREGGKRVSILYFSGVGGTKLVAELLGELLSQGLERSVTGIEDPRAFERAVDADLLVLCYPTYFLKPAPSMREFIEKLGPFDPPRDAYIVTTYELYSENSIRACAIMLKRRGVVVLGAKAIRAPGSDATCLFPEWLCPWLYRFEKGMNRKLKEISAEIDACVEDRGHHAFIPAPKCYTPFSQLLQILIFNRFEGWRERIRLLPERCTSCGVCAKLCDRGAWIMSEGRALHIPERCELCTRCIHRCPGKAIVLIEGLKDNRRLEPRLYARLKEEARGVPLRGEDPISPSAE